MESRPFLSLRTVLSSSGTGLLGAAFWGGGCHGGSGGLTLRGDFEVNTVNVPALGAGLDRIEPGDPDSSYLFHKLRGTQRDVGGGGNRMPLGGPFWADWELERLRLWILAR